MSVVDQGHWRECDDDTPYRRLIAAVLLQAIDDARRGNGTARRWLKSRDAHWWAALLELDCWPPGPEQLTSVNPAQHRRVVEK